MPRYVKTTGSKGVHVYVPIVRGPTQKAGVDIRQAARARAGRAAPGPDHRRVPDREAARGPRARRLQPERVGPHARVGLFAASDAATRPCRRRSRGRSSKRGATIDDFRIDNVPARIAALGDLWAPMADRRHRFDLAPLLAPPARARANADDAPAADRLRADGGEARRRAARGAAVAVRAEMGRVPLPRVQGRRRRRAAVEGRAAVQPLLSRDRRGDAGAAGAALRARRRDRRPARRHAVVRRAADAHPSGGEPRAEARARASGGLHRVRPARRQRRNAARRALARRTARRTRGIRANGVRRPTGVSAVADDARARRRGPLVRIARHRARRRDREAASICPTAPAIGRACRSSSRCARRTASSAAFAMARARDVVGSLLLGLYDDDGLLHHVGFTSNIPRGRRKALTREAGEARSSRRASPAARPAVPAAGAPSAAANGSRCATTLVVEVRYDHFSARTLSSWHESPALAARQGAAQCTFEQVRHEPAGTLLPRSRVPSA